ncbi:MAG: NAD(P)H-hydrate dehydratase [Phycisphaerae bacterium]|nr:NAD(P)H-hydrate dehydratase [Phycisphaerae bacterium]
METITVIPKLSPRPADGHKGTFGKVLIVGGSIGYSGAPALAGIAALRSGAGLVRVAVPASVQPIVAAVNPCYTTIALKQDSNGRMSAQDAAVINQMLAENDVIAFGPGAGMGAGVKETLLCLIKAEGLKLVIDADGLNVLSQCGGSGGWLDKKKADVILTPHPGEMQRLWKSVFREPMPENRQTCASEFARKSKSIVVLKGAGTTVADGERLYVNDTGNPGMATAGSGDVLTGVIAALAGQGLSLFDAAVLGVYIHGLAGDAAAKIRGQVSMIASDIVEHLGHAFIQVSE